jgi:hypothetical protein
MKHTTIQLVIKFIFYLKKNKFHDILTAQYHKLSKYIYVYTMNVKKPPSQAAHLEQVWTQVLHLQALDYRKLSHVSGYASARFDFGRNG